MRLHASPSSLSALLGAGPLSTAEDPLHARRPAFARHSPADIAANPSATSPKAARAQAEQHLLPIAPPASEPGVSPGASLTASATDPARAPIVVPTSGSPDDDDDDDDDAAERMAAWVEDAKDKIITESGCLHLPAVKVLSHALPCPSLTGHLFSQIIAAIHDRSSTVTSWINVFHAVPGRYTLSDLPKSPPSTPGPVVGGDEYFTSKVFDSAVAIPDYQLDAKLLPPSPRPVVPPRSINISVVERYIPPTNTNEFADMFNLKGRSLLHDRLTELSSESGILLFIYPTKTGAKTFMQQYLGPVIEPLLRTVTVVHDLHSELGRDLGQMAAVNHLDEYAQLREHVTSFCHGLEESMRNNVNEREAYQVIHAVKEELVLERQAWADDWWIKQEKNRIRDVISRYFRKSKKLPTGEMTGAHLIQEVLEGVSKREYQDGLPTRGVEVGVFIIKKTKSA